MSARIDADARLKDIARRMHALKRSLSGRFGDMVIMSGADRLDANAFMGAMLTIAEEADPTVVEAWRDRGDRFFRGSSPRAGRRARPRHSA